MTGVVDRFYLEKGFGYVRSADLFADLFVHVRDVILDHHGKSCGWRELRVGDVLEFEVAETERGPRASGARVIEPAPDEYNTPPASANSTVPGSHLVVAAENRNSRELGRRNCD